MKIAHLARLLCIAAIGFGFGLSARAQVIEQIEYDAIGNFILDTNGAPAPLGDAVLLGTWAPGFNFSANQTFSSLSAAFTQYDSTTIISPGQFSDNALITMAGQENKQLYIWVLNNPVPSMATAWVIVTNTAQSWKVPSDTGQGGSTIIDTSDVGVFIPTGAFGVGVFDPVSPNQMDWKMTSSAAAIPEPSTFALLGLGAVGMFALRRRVKS